VYSIWPFFATQRRKKSLSAWAYGFPGVASGCAFMAVSRHFFAKSTLMAVVGDAERRRIWTVTKSADKALAVFRMTTSGRPG
jgi:hypothetical protein